MGRPRSNNLKMHMDWAHSTNAFRPSFSFIDSEEFRTAGRAQDPPIFEPIPVEQAPQSHTQSTAQTRTQSRAQPDYTPSTNSLPTPPLHSGNSGNDVDFDTDSDSDLEYLAQLSEPSKTSSKHAEPLKLHTDAPAVGLSPSNVKEDVHVIDTSSGPNTPQRFNELYDSDIGSTASQPFRFSQAPLPMDMEPPRQELGSVFSEKIALLEQKVRLLSLELSSRNIYCDTRDVDEKIREVDRRIEEFPDDNDDNIFAHHSDMHLSSSPQVTRVGAGLPNYIDNDQFDSDFIECKDLNDSDEDDDIVSATRTSYQQDVHTGNTLEAHQYAGMNNDDSVDDVQILDCSPVPYSGNMNTHTEEDPFRYHGEDSEIIGTEPLQQSAPAQLPFSSGSLKPPSAYPSQAQPPSGPPAPAALTTQAWTKDMMHILRTRFGLQGFRPNQAEAVNETLAGNDVVVLMPTGGGKSLCYQLPALVTTGSTRGTTVVISPLISLMQDQVYHLKNRNIQAEMLNSRLKADERSAVFSLLNSGELQLLYISPEMLSASGAMQQALRRLYLNNRLARIVIDEAHCVSSWGHDFRPEYMELTKVKNEYPATPIMALTATANERVLLDIVGCLRSNPIVLKQSFNRRNLYYEVRPKTANIIGEISAVCRMYPGKSGIIYCHSKRNCEDTAQKLRQSGISAEFYHAGMPQEQRALVQQNWQNGRCSVVCATIAFGMGIDKPDVRYVMHMTLPRNIEGYYQETGRAGRDGKPSHCILFYSYRDVQLLQKMIQQDSQLSAHIREHHRTLLVRVMQYCENKTDCRRQQVLQYFNEDFNSQMCHQQCDNCRNMTTQGVVPKDMTAQAKVVVQIVQQIAAQHVTTQQVTDVLLGRKTRKSKTCGFDNMPWFGTLQKLGPLLVERLVHALICERVIEEYSQYNHSRYPQSYIKLGQNAMRVANGQMPIRLSMPRDSEESVPAVSHQTNTDASSRPVYKRRGRGGSKFRNSKRTRG